MAMLTDPGAFGKGAEKQDEAMKGLGIEKTDTKAEAEKKKKEEEKKKGTDLFFHIILFLVSYGLSLFSFVSE